MAEMQLFRDLYSAYIGSVSPAAMALSFQSLEGIWERLCLLGPSRVVEYGSGISTCLLATYASQSGCEVESFDSQEEWCDKTRGFLLERGLGQWVTIKAVDLVEPVRQASFVLWD
jgi:tRNA A58 N-methylase Trm61